ncbi:MAG: Probable secreted glycosyl hydrolase [uncultured Phycisphaerae bacterium]|uniref:Probable secreted glycosyl hydrolase n=1 Tax=uncultured Phycisphaerae bacterium TaxID=904963 RepID=A0A6J4P4E7_9BACT|nr:MAG: Probable secreted glycosyl hydrolase [uncultured Phycisphaerae bacterium]
MTRTTPKLRLAALGLAGVAFAGGAYVASAADKAPAAAKETVAQWVDGAATLTEQEKAAGWRLLFDGKSADQFRSYNKPDGKLNEKWQVKDGALVLTGKGGGDIVTKEQFESYELVLEYRISPGGNSGLMFHVVEVPGKPPYDSGPEVQIQDNVAGKDPQRAGWLYQMYQPPTDPKTGKPVDATKPAGEWNQLRFVLNGPKGEIHMNGVKYAEFEVGSEDWNRRLAESKFAKWANFAKAKKGHIALQDHGDEVAFRNIKIRPIAAQ